MIEPQPLPSHPKPPLLQFKNGAGTTATVVFSLFAQGCIVLVCHRKRESSELLRELLYVVFCVKPGIDVYRVISNAEQHELAILSPTVEMLYIRSAELALECLPGTLIQAVAFIQSSEEQTRLTSLSLAISILTSAFIGASISIEKDLELNARRKDPNFYGFVPLESKPRTIATCLLTYIMSICQLASKTFACALCASVSESLLAAFLLGEMALFFLYKAVRREFSYWVPLYGVPGFAMSVATRLVVKVMVDFTGLIQFRHHVEMGGVAWACTMVITPLTCGFFGWLYLEHVQDPENVRGVARIFTAEQVYGAIGGLVGIQALATVLFFHVIKRKYVPTFFTTMSSRQDCVNLFNMPELKDKVRIFKYNRHLWDDHAHEVRAWLNSNVASWNSNNPSWWDEKVKASIPDDFVDDPNDLEEMRRKQRAKRLSKITGSTDSSTDNFSVSDKEEV